MSEKNHVYNEVKKFIETNTNIDELRNMLIETLDNGDISLSEDLYYNYLNHFDKAWDSLKNELQSQVFGKFGFFEEDRLGSVFLDNNKVTIYCTPFWEFDPCENLFEEDEIGINIDISHDGDSVEQYVIPFPYPTNNEEFLVFKGFYIQTLKNLSEKFG